MEHHFDIDYAKEYGLLEAILINNFQFWIRKNAANEQHQHDGHFWTYNTRKGMKELFPYIKNELQIWRAIDNLVKQGVLIKGNYNQTPMDRTSWYAFADEEKFAIVQICKMDCSKMNNGLFKNEQPIPYNNPYNNISLFNSACAEKVTSWLWDNEEALLLTCKNLGIIIDPPEFNHANIDPIIKEYTEWLQMSGKEDVDRIGRSGIKTMFMNWYRTKQKIELEQQPKVEQHDSRRSKRDVGATGVFDYQNIRD